MMIEAARMANGLALADVFLTDLEHSGDLGRVADVAVRFEDFARHGQLQVPHQLKYLRDGIWQIKAVTVRLLFYYTEHLNRKTVRLTNGYVKRARECPPKVIRLATRVRGDDQQR